MSMVRKVQSALLLSLWMIGHFTSADECGDRGQRCCTLEDGIPAPITYEEVGFTNARRIDQAESADARFCNRYDNDVCDPVTDTCVDEDLLTCGGLGEACCDLAVDVAGRSCAFAYKHIIVQYKKI